MGQKEAKGNLSFQKRSSFVQITQGKLPEIQWEHPPIVISYLHFLSFFPSETTHLGNKNGPFIEHTHTTNNCFMITFNTSPNTQKCSKQYCFLNEIITLCFGSIRKHHINPKQNRQIDRLDCCHTHAHARTRMKNVILQIHVRELSNGSGERREGRPNVRAGEWKRTYEKTCLHAQKNRIYTH